MLGNRSIGYMKAKEHGKAHVLYEDNSIFAEPFSITQVLEYLTANWVCDVKIIPYDESLPIKNMQGESKIMHVFRWEPSEQVLQFMRKR